MYNTMLAALALAFALGAGPAAGAQVVPAPAPVSAAAPCDYRTCALSIITGLDGPSILRGVPARRIATLSFFWPGDITATLAGDDRTVAGADSAAAEARYALQMRQVGAALTDGGIAMVGIAALAALRARHVRTSDGIIAAVGIAAIGVSVPFHFAADGALGRAVWWHNVRYGR